MRRDISLSHWRTLPLESEGLTAVAVAEQRARHGRNDILEVVVNPWLELARDTLKDPMIWFLIGTGVIYAALGSYTESIALLVAILPLIGMDAFLHRRTQASTEGLSQRLAATAKVWRDGGLLQIPAADLVPGDLVSITTGDVFSADGLIVAGENLQADESSLTGEAYPVKKRALSALPHGMDGEDTAVWVEGEHWGLAGTRLLTGIATVRIVYTGAQTLYGEIVQAASTSHRERSRCSRRSPTWSAPWWSARVCCA